MRDQITSASSFLMAQEQAENLFDYRIDIFDKFAISIPMSFPWQEFIAILVPPGVDNRLAMEALKKYRLFFQGDLTVNSYRGYEASEKPRLFITKFQARPTKDTLGRSPDELVLTDRVWLPLKAYLLAFGQFHEGSSGFLDERTHTMFPNERENILGGVAHIGWSLDHQVISSSFCHRERVSEDFGAREAVEIPLKA